MTVHLIKLCVGCPDPAQLALWAAERSAAALKAGRPASSEHVTRAFPRRAAEVLDGGSLYWVIDGYIQVRQSIIDLVAVDDEEGRKKCAIRMEPRLMLVSPVPRGPFQGWRYFGAQDAPPDREWYDPGSAANAVPQAMLRDLAMIGVR